WRPLEAREAQSDLEREVASRLGLVLDSQQGELEHLAARSRPVDLLPDSHAQQCSADRRQHRYGALLAGVLRVDQGQMVVLVAAFLTAVNARVHRDDTGRQLATLYHLGSRQLLLERLGSRTVIIQAIEQPLQTLKIG